MSQPSTTTPTVTPPPAAPQPATPAPSAPYSFIDRLKSARRAKSDAPEAPSADKLPVPDAGAPAPADAGAAPAQPKDPAAAATDPKDAAKEDAKKPIKVKPAKKEPAPVNIDVVAGKIADSVREGVTKAVKSVTAAKAADAVPDIPPDPAQLDEMLPESFQGNAEVFLEMERLNPGKYKGKLVKELVDFKSKEKSYVADWKAAHQNESFNSEDSEHDAFYAKNEPIINERDFKSAERAINVRALEEVADRKLKPVINEFERNQRIQRVQPVIAQAWNFALKGVLEAVNPKAAEALSNPDEFSKMVDGDPELNRVALEALNGRSANGRLIQPGVNQIASAAIEIYNGVTAFDPNNPAHREAQRIMDGLEAEWISRPAEDSILNGKRFMDRDGYAKLDQAERGSYWTLDHDWGQIIDRAIAEYGAKAAEEYKMENEKFEAWAKKKGLTSSAPVAKASPTQTPAQPSIPAQNTQPAAPTNTGPTVTGRVSVGSDPASNGSGLATGLSLLRARLRSR